jgi:hypothetical protein
LGRWGHPVLASGSRAQLPCAHHGEERCCVVPHDQESPSFHACSGSPGRPGTSCFAKRGTDQSTRRLPAREPRHYAACVPTDFTGGGLG